MATLIFAYFSIHKLRAGDDEPLVKCKPSEVERKGRIRAATRSLICVVFTYLLANVLSVVLAFWVVQLAIIWET